MTTNNNDTSPILSYHDYMLDNSKTINVGDLFYDNSQNTMYYTTNTGTISTITMSDTWSKLNDIQYHYPKEFEHVMPDLTKVKEMCSMYPAMDKAFENFKAIYDLIKDDYEARKNNDS